MTIFSFILTTSVVLEFITLFIWKIIINLKYSEDNVIKNLGSLIVLFVRKYVLFVIPLIRIYVLLKEISIKIFRRHETVPFFPISS